MLNDWFEQQDVEFKQFVKDPKVYMRTSASLKELEELDNRFINNSPEGDNDRASGQPGDRVTGTGNKL